MEKTSKIGDNIKLESSKTEDKKVFENIYNTYKKQLLKYGEKICGNREDGKDIIQEAFLAAYKYLPTFRGESSLKNWLYKLAKTACLKKKLNQTASNLSLLEKKHVYYNNEKTLDIESKLLKRELERVVREAINRLPNYYGEILQIVELDGMSIKEASEKLMLSISGIKSRLHRARKMLKAMLESYIIEEP